MFALSIHIVNNKIIKAYGPNNTVPQIIKKVIQNFKTLA